MIHMKLFDIKYAVSFKEYSKTITITEKDDGHYDCELSIENFPVRRAIIPKEKAQEFRSSFLKFRLMTRGRQLENCDDITSSSSLLCYGTRSASWLGIEDNFDKFMNGLFEYKRLNALSFECGSESFSLNRSGELKFKTGKTDSAICSYELSVVLAWISAGSIFLERSKLEKSTNGVKKFVITLTYEGGSTYKYQGLFDLKGLPAYWSSFVMLLSSAAGVKIPLRAFNSIEYSTGRMTPTLKDRIIAVQFQKDGQKYQYRTDRSDLKVGDRVIVPVGREHTLKIVTVSDTSTDAPVEYPYEMMKHIIRKADEPGYTPRRCDNFRILLAEKETYDLLKKLSGVPEDKDITRDVLINKVHLENEAFEELKSGVALLDKTKPILDYITFSLDHYLFESMVKPPAIIDSVPLLLRWYALSRELSDIFVYIDEEELISILEKTLHKLGLTKKSGKAKKSERWHDKKVNKLFVKIARAEIPRICIAAVKGYIRSEGILD